MCVVTDVSSRPPQEVSKVSEADVPQGVRRA